MGSATATTYEWLCEEFTDGTDETWLCAGFVRDLSPREALRRIHVAPGSLSDSGQGVAAYAASGGTVLIEYGWARTVYDKTRLLSAGTAAASVYMNIKNDGFTYCVDSRRITTFSLYAYSLRKGADPDRLHPDAEDLGMDIDGDQFGFPDDPVSSALALAERATGVHLSPARFARPALIGSTDHIYPMAADALGS
ncbi:DUF6461 domain-containing protein [Planomonospora parontospora]|uniref:DUF6461 domain-containing protein n=1 Tax=Planomonospora parontospora TaxID=58119 RepID=UPI0016714CB6|nr:DUF6461 domain-containing protein [Planomonospora parontospora]GGL34345.1 hypothetical protein GCM10014719_39480 [Planomonospora parontospora subsp. antibiotica]GII17059.1 hypothetical protein Ppa05_37850 [Planomonospora parontospora subsp. antibiotica]